MTQRTNGGRILVTHVCERTPHPHQHLTSARPRSSTCSTSNHKHFERTNHSCLRNTLFSSPSSTPESSGSKSWKEGSDAHTRIKTLSLVWTLLTSKLPDLQAKQLQIGPTSSLVLYREFCFGPRRPFVAFQPRCGTTRTQRFPSLSETFYFFKRILSLEEFCRQLRNSFPVARFLSLKGQEERDPMTPSFHTNGNRRAWTTQKIPRLSSYT